MFITDEIKYVGVDDHDIDLFEGQFEVPGGMAYNSYVILDEKIAVMDSVDRNFGAQWIANIEEVLGGRKPDYLVVQHMEPDHSANIALFMEHFPEAVVVSSKMAQMMMQQFFGTNFAGRNLAVGEGDTLELGTHTLSFIAAPMVHWPEVIMTYDAKEKTLFSADGFGKFGAQDYDDPEGWACEARRYYFGIVGKFGASVQAVLQKAAGLDIARICPLHGPVLDEDLGYYLEKYDTWSSYRPEDSGVTICYASVYGHTKEAAEKLAELLEAKGCASVSLFDLARDDMFEAIEDAFRYDRLVLASITYAMDIFPVMRTFIEGLTERDYQNRRVAFIENGSWSPMAKRIMSGMFEKSKDITFAENAVTIRGALNAQSLAQLEALAEEFRK